MTSMANFKLNKVEKRVLVVAERSYRGEFSTWQRKGHISRDLIAMRKLRVKGMMSLDHEYDVVEFSDRIEDDVMYYVTQDHITDKGIKIAKNLSRK